MDTNMWLWYYASEPSRHSNHITSSHTLTTGEAVILGIAISGLIVMFCWFLVEMRKIK